MIHPSETDIEKAILEALTWRISGYPTYVLRNWLPRDMRTCLSTPQVLYHLKKLEAAGKVERVPSNYAVMICWRVKE